MRNYNVNVSEALADFRNNWTGERVLTLLREKGGKLLISWPVGVGKSTNIDSVIETAITNNLYDLVIALMPTNAVLKERKWVCSPPKMYKVVTLRPRPSKKCGESKDNQWKVFEVNNMGLHGRKVLCKPCQNGSNCFWPKQYGKELENARVIFGNQTHLQRDPHFIQNLRKWSGAKRVLVICDESNFLTATTKKTITEEQLRYYLDITGEIND